MTSATGSTRHRQRIAVAGVVQGVGFRPFVYVLARELGLSGSVANTGGGVSIEVEGSAEALAVFGIRLRRDAPPLAEVIGVQFAEIAVRGGTDFTIGATEMGDDRAGGGRTLVSPDVAMCEACLAELADPRDRRHRHPFVSCTNCGPRFTVIVELPYDRPATTMADLPLCKRCASEYVDPADRRFHAQTVACPQCGPTLRLWQPGEEDRVGNGAMAEARRLLVAGAVVAVKGLGGYHLACDADNETAVATLRKRKDRGDKPFAVMVADLGNAERLAVLSRTHRALLSDHRRPVVLAPKRLDGVATLAPSVSPGHPDVGVMLAYTPVHHLLFGLPGDPPGPTVLVMTSGNRSGAPIVTDDEAARTQLADLADAWLSHDRPIQVPCDDSVLRVADDRELPVRRSRGWAPLPIALPVPVRPVLAVGGDLKNTFALAEGRYAWLSAHVGDMDDLATTRAFETATGHLKLLTGVRPELIVADRHPRYRSSAWAERNPERLPVIRVQHHHAHIASAMAENGHDGAAQVIGFAFDGTGYGDDGAAWGGEVLLADYDGYTRAAHLAYVPLPGGDAGVRNPCRMALSHLRAAGLAWDERLPSVAACSAVERRVLTRQLERGLACIPTSSMGRLFDAVSSLAGVCHRVAYEAEAAMCFEGLARAAIAETDAPYLFGPAVLPSSREPDPPTRQVDAAPVIRSVVADVRRGVPTALIAARFHLAVAALVRDFAVELRARTALDTVALSGGVFLNVVLHTLCTDALAREGFRVLTHRQVPPSDAGLALGQLAIAARSTRPSARTRKVGPSCA